MWLWSLTFGLRLLHAVLAFAILITIVSDSVFIYVQNNNVWKICVAYICAYTLYSKVFEAVNSIIERIS